MQVRFALNVRLVSVDQARVNHRHLSKQVVKTDIIQSPSLPRSCVFLTVPRSLTLPPTMSESIEKRIESKLRAAMDVTHFVSRLTP